MAWLASVISKVMRTYPGLTFGVVRKPVLGSWTSSPMSFDLQLSTFPCMDRQYDSYMYVLHHIRHHVVNFEFNLPFLELSNPWEWVNIAPACWISLSIKTVLVVFSLIYHSPRWCHFVTHFDRQNVHFGLFECLRQALLPAGFESRLLHQSQTGIDRVPGGLVWNGTYGCHLGKGM